MPVPKACRTRVPVRDVRGAFGPVLPFSGNPPVLPVGLFQVFDGVFRDVYRQTEKLDPGQVFEEPRGEFINRIGFRPVAGPCRVARDPLPESFRQHRGGQVFQEEIKAPLDPVDDRIPVGTVFLSRQGVAHKDHQTLSSAEFRKELDRHRNARSFRVEVEIDEVADSPILQANAERIRFGASLHGQGAAGEEILDRFVGDVMAPQAEVDILVP